MYYLENPFVYRIHEKPSEEKLNTFYGFLDGLGVKYRRKKDEVYPKDFQAVLKSVEDSRYYTLVNRVMLRSMQKAKYSDEDVGHFGLSVPHYCHFTSPIRRYPDLQIHRIIKDLLKGEKNLDEKYQNRVADVAKQSSLKERNASDAERAVDDYYKLLYISEYEGEEFDGVVSGVTSFGIFVELDNGVEGIVRAENLSGRRRLDYDEKNFTVKVGKVSYKLGESVRIKVIGVNLGERRAEFAVL
jgi:ribonuclease R